MNTPGKTTIKGYALDDPARHITIKPTRTWVSDAAWEALSPRAKIELGIRLDREGNNRPPTGSGRR